MKRARLIPTTTTTTNNNNNNHSSMDDDEEEDEDNDNNQQSLFSIMTYNVLAEHLCRPAWFKYRTKEELDFEKTRWEVLKQTLHKAAADIMCLQELQCVHGPVHVRGKDHHVELFDTYLRQQGYSGTYQSRMTANATQPSYGLQVGNGIWWKSSRFDPVVVESNGVAILRIIAQACGTNKKLRSSFAGSDMRGTVASFVALQCKLTSEIIVVATTHLPAPRDDSDAQSKMEQLVHACALLHALADFCVRVEEQLAPRAARAVIVAGDFNSTPGSPIYQLFEHGRLSNVQVAEVARAAGQLQLPFCNEAGEMICPSLRVLATPPVKDETSSIPFFQSAMKIALHGHEPEFTNLTQNYTGCLDYIFMASSSPLLFHVAHGSDPTLGLDKERFLPDPANGQGSDHLPITCTFEMKQGQSDSVTSLQPCPDMMTESATPVPEWVQLAFRYKAVDTIEMLETWLDECLTNCHTLMFTTQGIGTSGRTCPVTVLTIKPWAGEYLQGTSRDLINQSEALVIDVKSLTPQVVFGARQSHLKRLLESPDVLKICHNCRYDSDALFHQFQITLQNVMDTSLWHQACVGVNPELASKTLSQLSKRRGGATAPPVLGLLNLASAYLHPIDVRALRFVAPHKNDREAWDRRPMIRPTYDYAAAQVHLTELVARAMIDVGIPSHVLGVVQTRSSELLKLLRDRAEPVTMAADAHELMGAFDLYVNQEL